MKKEKKLSFVKILKLFFNRIFISIFFAVIQILWMFATVSILSEYFILINTILRILSVLIILGIIKKERHLANKMSWVILIMVLPIFGTALYVALEADFYTYPILKKMRKSSSNSKKYLIQNKEVLNKIKEENLDVYGQTAYISKYAGYPIYENRKLEYYKLGEEAFPAILKELEKAEKFIFIEFFIISKGKMWKSILEILERKVKEGVDVRVIYDDVGCIKSLPYKYYKELEKKGIKCIVFNKLRVILSAFHNNRDHRKIMVIDGHTAFSGGINLSDEYINEYPRFGHWKDNFIKITGESVWNFTVMFLEIWNAYKNEDKDFKKFKFKFSEDITKIKDGYICPYGETPLVKEPVGENIYLNILNQAKRYVYIFTPYLIVDNEMISALTLAAKRGVDVRLVTPGIPDKKIVFSVTKSYYEQLVEEGVKIYKYTPGFIHAKVFVCDDEIATVGTLNLDYRSLYFHFECGTYIYKSKIISKIKKDALETMEKSKLLTLEECKTKFFKELWQSVLRFLAPIM